MAKINFLFVICFILFCNAAKVDSSAPSLPKKNDFDSIQSGDTTGWINSFREFRSAVYQNDKNKIKQFIVFPIMNVNNEIWYLAYGNNDKLIHVLTDKIKPFTAQDFDKYEKNVFTERFIATILKIKSENLYNTGGDTTKDLEDGDTFYRMYASVNKKTNTLTLNLSSKNFNSGDDDGELSITYQFDIVNNKEIKFRQVRIAG